MKVLIEKEEQLKKQKGQLEGQALKTMSEDLGE